MDEDFAQRYWPQKSAIGQRLFLGARVKDDREAFTVVGVVGSVKQVDVTEDDALGAIYYPYIFHTDNRAFLVTRTSGQPSLLGPTLQKVIRNADPDLPPGDVRTMEGRVADSLVTRTSPALLAGAFAAVALLLAAIGTYGVLSYTVSQSRREIGVRLALGALPSQIRHLFLSLGLRLVAFGSLLGVAGALLARQAMQGILYDVPTLPFGTIGVCAALLLLVSIAACLVPTWRASRVHPAEALRSE